MSSDARWHVERQKQILAQYPDIKQYVGAYPLSLVPILGLVLLQWGVAYGVRELDWWLIGLIAFCLGQFILHSLSTFIHEAVHGLILPRRKGSLASLMLIELGIPSFGHSLRYFAQHGPSHHLYLNDYQRDYEWWDKQQSAFFSSHVVWRWLEALLHLLPGGPILTDLLTDQLLAKDSDRQLKATQFSTQTKLIFTVLSVVTYAIALAWLGPKSVLYLFWSLSLMVSNWGITFRGQSISEHHNFQDGKTFSTYHWTNFLMFNTGFHDEHHTFPTIPWIHLPKVKRIAPEYFTNDSPYNYFQWWGRWAYSIFTPSRFNRYQPVDSEFDEGLLTKSPKPLTSHWIRSGE